MPPLDSSGAPGTDQTTSDTAVTTSDVTTGADTIAGVDLAAVLADLDEAHVAGVESQADLSTLADQVDTARSHGLTLWVVSIGRSISNSDTAAIAQALFDTTGGTMLVLSPTQVSARSDQLTTKQRNDAIKAAAAAKNDQRAVSLFIDSALTSTGVSTGSTPTTSSSKVGTVGGIDVDAVLAALGGDHIAVSPGVTEVTAKQLAGPVTRAWNADLKLYVAILSKDATGHLYDVSSAVMHRTGGTVLVVSPSLYALSSTTLTDGQLNDALDAGADASSYVALVRTVVDSLLG